MTGPAEDSVTVILPTYRRPAGLAAALDGLASQEEPGITWDVVVIDNAPAPGAEDAFRRAEARLGGAARYVREPQQGSAHARNRGIAEAAGTITAMLDDDVVPATDWLRRLLEPLLTRRAEGVGGRVILDPSVRRPRWFHEKEMGDYLGQWHLDEAEREIAPPETIVTSNCAFRTDLLRASGAFDPALGPRGRLPLVNDDTLLTRRFIANGGRVRYVPAAVVVHRLPRERLRPRYLLRRAYAQGRSDWILDRDVYAARRFGGVRLIWPFFSARMRWRFRDGITRPDVAFRALCDVARVIGSAREAAALTLERRRLHQE